MRRDHLVVLLAAGSIACGSSSPPPTVNTVVITATALELPVGGTLQLVANAFDASGILIPGTKAAWTSSDPRIATISDVGVLSGVAFGDTNVTATVNGVTGTQPFTVSGIQSGAGSATVDGSMAAGEWSRASVLDIAAVNLPGGTTPGKLYVMNDGTDLYLALTFSRTPPAGETSDLSFEFDNDASGTLSAGDDGLIVSDGVFEDRTAAPCQAGGGVCSFRDIDVGGAKDGDGAFANAGGTSIYELRHPLRSMDSHD
ncbi:MAG: Ig-like domain-containing protein, partial [Myxococcales bacterium]